MSGNQADQLRKALEQRRQQLSKSFGQNQNQSNGSQRPSNGQKSAGRSPGKSGQQGNGQESGDGNGGDTQLDPNKAGHASRQVDPSAGHGPGGDTPLVFGDSAEMDPERLKFEALPKGNGGEGEELFGLRAANPKVGRQALNPGTSSGAQSGDQAPGNGEQPMLPKNRALIEKYFDTK